MIDDRIQEIIDTVTFDKQMSRVATVTGYTRKEFNILRKLAEEMGRKTTKSATEAAQAMEYIGSFKT